MSANIGPLPTTPNPIFDYNTDAARYFAPLSPYGTTEGVFNLNSFYVEFFPFFLRNPRDIVNLQVQVTTAQASYTLGGAAYRPRSFRDPLPGLRITDSAFSGVDCSSTGLKTVTFSPTWRTPLGLFWLALKGNRSGGGSVALRALTGTGRENLYFLGKLNGYANNPAADFSNAGGLSTSPGDTASPLSDYTGVSIAQGGLASQGFAAVFLK